MPQNNQGILIDKDLRPAYYDDFHCLAGQCHLSCCKGWHISFDKKDYLALKHEKGSPQLNQRLENNLRRIRRGPLAEIHYGEFAMPEGCCPLLREDSLCALQAEKGHQALPLVCRIFPRGEIALPSGYLERSLSPACEGVLALLWNLPDGVDFVSDPLPPDKRKLHIFDEQQVLSLHFQQIRSLCIDLLQNRSFSLPHRILLMGVLLKELADGEQDIPHWLEKAGALTDMSLAQQLLNQSGDKTLPLYLSNNIKLLLSLSSSNDDLSLLRDQLIKDMEIEFHENSAQATIPAIPYLEARQRFEQLPQSGYFMENLMVSLFFHLHLPHTSSPEALWKSYVNFCNLYSFYRFLSVMSCRPDQQDPQSAIFRSVVHASRNLIHNGAQQITLRDELFKNDSATLAHMTILLSN